MWSDKLLIPLQGFYNQNVLIPPGMKLHPALSSGSTCDRCRMRRFLQAVMWPCGLTFLFVKPADAAAVVVGLEQQLSEKLPQMDGLARVAAHPVWPGIVVGFWGFSESVTMTMHDADRPEKLQFQTRTHLTCRPLAGSAPSLQQLKNRADESRDCLHRLIPSTNIAEAGLVCLYIYLHLLRTSHKSLRTDPLVL